MGAFTKASAEKQPKHYILARLKEAEDRGFSAKGNRVFGLKFDPVLSTRRREERFYLSFKPEWLAADFDPDSLERGPKFLHTNNMSGTTGVPPAEAIMGSEAFGELVAELNAAGTLTPEEFFAHIEAAIGRVVGLILTQEAEMIEGVDGKRKRVLTDNLAVNGFFLQSGVAELNKYISGQLAKADADETYKVTARASWEIDSVNPENSVDPFELAAQAEMVSA